MKMCTSTKAATTSAMRLQYLTALRAFNSTAPRNVRMTIAARKTTADAVAERIYTALTTINFGSHIYAQAITIHSAYAVNS